VLIIDDSIEKKPYTDENELVKWHYSHAKHRCIKGINLMSSLVRYDDTALPRLLKQVERSQSNHIFAYCKLEFLK
jgi:hypothetical protein